MPIAHPSAFVVILGLSHFFPPLAQGLVAFGTLALAVATGMLIWYGREQEKQRRADAQKTEERERKERLINEVIEWAFEIKKAPSEVGIPLEDALYAKRITQLDLNTILRYTVPFVRMTYIRTIVSRIFPTELKDDVEEIIPTFTIFLFLFIKVTGSNPKKWFAGEALEITEEFEKQFLQDERNTEKLLDEFTDNLLTSINQILIKAGEIKSNLLSS